MTCVSFTDNWSARFLLQRNDKLDHRESYSGSTSCSCAPYTCSESGKFVGSIIPLQLYYWDSQTQAFSCKAKRLSEQWDVNNIESGCTKFLFRLSSPLHVRHSPGRCCGVLTHRSVQVEGTMFFTGVFRFCLFELPYFLTYNTGLFFLKQTAAGNWCVHCMREIQQEQVRSLTGWNKEPQEAEQWAGSAPQLLLQGKIFFLFVYSAFQKLGVYYIPGPVARKKICYHHCMFFSINDSNEKVSTAFNTSRNSTVNYVELTA